MPNSCAECGAAVGDGGFCSSCGAALASPAPGIDLQPQPPAAPASATPKRAKPRRPINRGLALAAGAGVLALVAVAIVVLAGDTTSGGPVPDSPERRKAAAVSCKTFTEQEPDARRKVIENAAPRGRPDNAVAIVLSVCELVPSLTVGQAIADGTSPPAAAGGDVPKIAAGLPADVPEDAVAVVGGRPITRSDFDRWFAIATASGKKASTSYVPPQFEDCVARKLSSEERTRAKARLECEREYDGQRDQTMQFLILAAWVRGEAAQTGLAPSQKLMERSYAKAKRDAFPKDDDYRNFLENSRMTASDARFQVAFNTLYTLLREKAVQAARAPTDAQIASHYEQNRARFKVGDTQQTLEQATPAIRQTLQAEAKTRADDAYNASLRERWQAVTLCGDDFVMEQCSNGPASATSTVAP